jgi:osmotically-inducible protein OsmY
VPVLNPASAERVTEPLNPQAATADVAERRLRSHPYLALKNISCYLFDGVLVLRGCLPTYYLKQLAQAAVASLKGVQRIDNQIQVVGVVVRETPPDQVKVSGLDTDAGGEESCRETSPASNRRTQRGVKVTAPYGEEIEVDG